MESNSRIVAVRRGVRFLLLPVGQARVLGSGLGT